MSKTYKLAPIIRKAADTYLYHPDKKSKTDSATSEYSCVAVSMYMNDKFGVFSSHNAKTTFENFAKSKGCPIHSMSAFNKYYSKEKVKRYWTDDDFTVKEPTAKSQEIRYAWLHLLADLAEEEDIKVKI